MRDKETPVIGRENGMPFTAVDSLAVDTIRMLSAEAVEKAQSGHAGTPMGAAPMAYVLWSRFMRYNPHNPDWFNRDRFVLSAGHASILLYVMLHLSGYDVTLDDLQSFRAMDSKTPGHPELGITPGVEATTGPLGQGFSMAVGMAVAERFMSSRFNKDEYPVVDHYTYVLSGDGDMMEGVTSEAASLAGHLGLHKLIVLYDSNDISQDGATNLTFTERVTDRFQAYGWNVLYVEDGSDLEAIEQAILRAHREQNKPTLIEIKTVIGYGAPTKQGTHHVHSGALGPDELDGVRAFLNWHYPPFTVPDAVRTQFQRVIDAGVTESEAWHRLLTTYEQDFPSFAQAFHTEQKRTLDVDWEDVLPDFQGSISGRDAFSKTIEAIAPYIPNLIGGSADLATSNRTLVPGGHHIGVDNYGERNVFYGVREHAMGAIMNGMVLHGGVIPFSGTFLVFADYMRPPMRMAALMGLPVIFVFTHDSLWVGEDGPTHQPVEQLTGMRSVPNLQVFRPADGTEVAQSVRCALAHTTGPSALVLSRQNLPVLTEVQANIQWFDRGGYVVFENSDQPDLILLASGSEVALTLTAAKHLVDIGIDVRVVSMPCMELFDRQDEGYRQHVLPDDMAQRMAVEMAYPMPWYKYVGREGVVIGVADFGRCGPGKDVAQAYGFTVERVVNKAKQLYYKRFGAR